MTKIKVIAIAGKSGAGKDTILRGVVNAAPEVFNEIVSCTTRPPRDNEIDGVNYHFITPEDFSILRAENLMLEWAEFNSWVYGTEKAALNPNKVNIGIFNPEGIISLMNNNAIDLTIVYIKAASKIRIMRQLNREENPNVDEIIRRYTTDEHDFSWLDKFCDFCFVNNDEKEKEYIIYKLITLGRKG